MSKIDFRQKEVEPVKKQDVIVGGACVGWVGEYVDSTEKLQFHAGINIDVNDMFPFLLQGFGAGPEAAIKNALVKGHKLANALYNGINRMQFDMDIQITKDEMKGVAHGE